MTPEHVRPSRRHACALKLSLAGLLAATLVSTAHSQTTAPSTPAPSGDDTISLNTFVVSTSQDKGYRPGNSVSATRIDTPIADLPFSITAFTQQFIQDTGAHDLFDIVRYAAGVNSFAREFTGGNTQYTVRGFAQGVLHDGFSEGDIYVDSVNIERVEVVKGPASLLYGQIQPGGIVNFITKRPEDKPFTDVAFSFGSYDYGRATIDYNQPLIDNKLLFRFNGGWENDFEYTKPTKQVTSILAPSATWLITPKLSLRVAGQMFSRQETPPAVYVPNMEVTTPTSLVGGLYNPGYPGEASALTNLTGPDAGLANDSSDPGFERPYPGLPRSFNYGNATDVRQTHLHSISAELDAALGEHWAARFNFNDDSNNERYYQTGIGDSYLAPPNSLVFSNGLWSVSPTWSALTSAQQVAQELAFAQQLIADPNAAYQTQNGTPAPVVIPRRQRLLINWNRQYTGQFDLAGHYDTSFGKLTPVIGAQLDRNYSYSQTWQNAGNAASPYYQTWDVDANSPTYYINRNPQPYVPSTSLSSYSPGGFGINTNRAAYAVLDGQFLHDRLFTVIGARYTQAESQGSQVLAGGGTTALGAEARQHYLSPQYGIGYKVTADSMLYASYSTSFTANLGQTANPQIVNNVWQTIPTGQEVPTTGKGAEAGYKVDFFQGRYSATVAVYSIEQDNVVQTFNVIEPSTPTVVGATVSTTIQGTAVRSRGVEFEQTFSPTDNLQIYATISEDDVRNIQEPFGFAYYLGAHPNGTAKTMANLWSRYNLTGALQGFWVGGGFNYMSAAEGDNRNKNLLLPAYCLWNGAIGYDFTFRGHKMTATVNGYNLGNTYYVPANQEETTPRRLIFQVASHF